MIKGLKCPQGMDVNHRSSRSMIVCERLRMSAAKKIKSHQRLNKK